MLFFPPAWLRFWRRTAMRHGWASMFGLFLCGTGRQLTFINGILPFFSIFADSLDHKKKGKENLRTGGGKRWREVEKRPTNAVICAGGHGKRIGQNWCSGNGFDLCSCRIKRRRVWAWCWSCSWSWGQTPGECFFDRLEMDTRYKMIKQQLQVRMEPLPSATPSESSHPSALTNYLGNLPLTQSIPYSFGCWFVDMPSQIKTFFP